MFNQYLSTMTQKNWHIKLSITYRFTSSNALSSYVIYLLKKLDCLIYRLFNSLLSTVTCFALCSSSKVVLVSNLKFSFFFFSQAKLIDDIVFFIAQ